MPPDLKNQPPSVLFLGKADDEYTNRALTLLRSRLPDITAAVGAWGDPLPPQAKAWRGDYIISYLSRWVLTAEFLRQAEVAAINFHPASPEYPGIGCNNFALYDNAKEYGATCHLMEAKVDTGAILAVRRFPVRADDTVATLLERTYEHQFALFGEILEKIARREVLRPNGDRWSRKPFTRKEFHEISKITPSMSAEEVRRRIRATNYKKWKPFVELHGFTFELKE